MQKQIRNTLLSTGLLIICAFSAQIVSSQNKAVFSYFEYTGKDIVFSEPIDPAREYRNPILSGFYPDPSICRKGDDYYLVNSTFSYYPGVPIFHSKDLVNWVQLGFVLNRPSQLKLDGIRLSGGIYAPAIEYNKHNDTFYMITTCVDGIGNFLVKTKNPQSGVWSDPILLPKVWGIDPSLFFDDDGKGYIVHNDAPEGKPEWDGHRAIWIHNFDPETDQTFGERQVLLDGGVDRSTKPVWIEGPHIYKINGKYYLMAAEGGTGTYHSEVVLKSDSVKGPYVPYEGNPILTQRDLPADRQFPVTSVGHADLIDAPDGQWYAMFLGCRPYQGDYYNTGRETFLLPVTWKDDFPVILDAGKSVPYIVEKESLLSVGNTLTGNFTWRDNFDTASLDYKWAMIRTPYSQWWNLNDGNLELHAIDKSISDKTNPAFLGYRQQNLIFEAQTEIVFVPRTEQELAGIVCFQNEKHNIVFGKIREQGVDKLIVDHNQGNRTRVGEYILKEPGKAILMKVTGENDRYSFYASFDKGNNWTEIASDIDAKILSTHVAGGFTGVMIGLYATSVYSSK